jgi:hypothetical protein
VESSVPPLALLRMKIARQFGWGMHPETVRGMRGLGWMYLGMFGLVVATFWLYPALEGRPSAIVQRIGWYSFTHLLPYTMTLFLAISIWIIYWHILALRIRSSGNTIVGGQCFAIIQDGHWIFVQIGMTPQTARWFIISAGWQVLFFDAIGMSDAFELDTLAANGYVEGFRRLGSRPFAIGPDNPEPDEAFVPHRPTRAEQKALRRQARIKGSQWGIAREYFRISIVATLFLVCLGFGFAVGAILALRSGAFDTPSSPPPSPQYAQEWADLVVFVKGGIVFIVALALVSCGFSVWYIRRARALAPQPGESQDVIEGVITNWSNYQTMTSTSRETIFALRDGEGKEHLYRVPQRFSGYARRCGQHVRVISLLRTGRVLNVMLIPKGLDAMPHT